ncbi:hypothetical protein FHS16_001100 [Paenibacillus endophyticus]|uniref:Uncharacterized protein n=1 Tax=Paenibacillus endophyticus TaxID=1294268 RepID=A0A7W5C4I5_9BACL|nr:hypothetical protein [Paenibacillus endophyticus]MBB3151066.1 hypothetical protein [Paenibacillus endophyticus]
MFDIKYEIFEDDILEFRIIDLQTFKEEYNQIYGCFTIIINGIEYLSYPSPEMGLETKRIYSELILTHFDFLIDVYYQLQKNNYVVLKYIENPQTWLEFIKEGNELIVSQLNLEIHEGPLIRTKRKLFINALKEEIINETILFGDFEKELISKSKELIKTLQELNKKILTANCFTKIKLFAALKR